MAEDQSNQTEIENEDNLKENMIELSAPWGGANVNRCSNFPKNGMSYLPEDRATARLFIKQRTELHRDYILQTSKNKRLGLLLAFFMIMLSILILVFAPDGRETLSYWIGSALLVFAAGALGYGRVWGKAASISFGADRDRRPL